MKHLSVAPALRYDIQLNQGGHNRETIFGFIILLIIILAIPGSVWFGIFGGFLAALFKTIKGK